MKKLILFSALLLMANFGFTQEKDKAGVVKKDKFGNVKSVEFLKENGKIPASVSNFLQEYLEIGLNDQFDMVDQKVKEIGNKHEHYDQYYKNIRVQGGGYNFHYKNGELYFANGYYIKIQNLNPRPTISLENAKEAFLNY